MAVALANDEAVSPDSVVAALIPQLSMYFDTSGRRKSQSTIQKYHLKLRWDLDNENLRLNHELSLSKPRQTVRNSG